MNRNGLFSGKMKKSNKCIIFAAGEFSAVSFTHIPDAFVIAADAGLSHARSLGITPGLTVGDFDSEKGELTNCGEIIMHPPEKDDTDTMLAVKEALKRGYTDIVLYGALGGRLDHTLANIQTLAYIASHGGSAVLIGTRETVTVLSAGTLTFPRDKRGTLSLFSLGDKCTGVTLTGLKYPLNNATLTNAFPLGVSNCFTGCESTVTLKEGMLLVITAEKEY